MHDVYTCIDRRAHAVKRQLRTGKAYNETRDLRLYMHVRIQGPAIDAKSTCTRARAQVPCCMTDEALRRARVHRPCGETTNAHVHPRAHARHWQRSIEYSRATTERWLRCRADRECFADAVSLALVPLDEHPSQVTHVIHLRHRSRDHLTLRAEARSISRREDDLPP